MQSYINKNTTIYQYSYNDISIHIQRYISGEHAQQYMNTPTKTHTTIYIYVYIYIYIYIYIYTQRKHIQQYINIPTQTKLYMYTRTPQIYEHPNQNTYNNVLISRHKPHKIYTYPKQNNIHTHAV
jgi:hypothetical protein